MKRERLWASPRGKKGPMGISSARKKLIKNLPEEDFEIDLRKGLGFDGFIVVHGKN